MPIYLGLYRYNTPFPEDVVIRALSITARWLPGFFPAALPVARKRSVRLASPADFDPSQVPAAFTIEPGISVRIPIDGNDGNELVVTDDRVPEFIPANVMVNFTTLPPFSALEGLMIDLVDTFRPNAARLTDETTPVEKDVQERRFQIDNSKVPPWFSWLTWLNPTALEAAGPEALARLSALCHVRPVAGGVIVRVQEEPTRGDDPEWSRRRQAAEDAFGLAALHRRFPRNID